MEYMVPLLDACLDLGLIVVLGHAAMTLVYVGSLPFFFILMAHFAMTALFVFDSSAGAPVFS